MTMVENRNSKQSPTTVDAMGKPNPCELEGLDNRFGLDELLKLRALLTVPEAMSAVAITMFELLASAKLTVPVGAMRDEGPNAETVAVKS